MEIFVPPDEYYVNNCAGCDHWRDYDFEGSIKTRGCDILYLYRCGVCYSLKALTKEELEEVKT